MTTPKVKRASRLPTYIHTYPPTYIPTYIQMGLAGVEKDFFDSNNQEGMKTREEMAAAVLDEAYDWLASAEADEPR